MKYLVLLLLLIGSCAAQNCTPSLLTCTCSVQICNGLAVDSSSRALLLDAPQPKIPPASVKVHSFIDNTNLALFSSSAAALTAEAQMSCTVPDNVCKQVTIGAAGFFVAEVSVAGVLHKTGHHTMERSLGPSVALFHIARMVWISTHRR